MKVKITPVIRNRIFAALMAAGVSGPVAYIGANHTLDSEGMYTTPYLDPVGLKTMCVGHLATKRDVVKKSYAVDECIDMYVKDFILHKEQLDKMVKVPWRSQWMYGASIDFTFHQGQTSVRASTHIKDLNAMRYDKACEELTRWVFGRVNGIMTKMPGLVIRATKRYEYCMGNVPADYKTVYQQWEDSR